MATQAWVNDASNQTDALFRAWGKAISDALLAVGLVKAADTGQINWATATRPTTPDSASGYEVWRFADALQATAPVFIKIRYGAPGAPNVDANSPGILVTVGTGTDGAGNITGVKTEELLVGMWQNYGGSGQAFKSFLSGAANRVALAHSTGYGGGNTTLPFGFSVERTHDSGGADTNEGVIVQAWGATHYIGGSSYTRGASTQQVLLFTGVQADSAPRNIYQLQGNALMLGTALRKTGIVGPDTAVFPWLAPSARGYENPSMAFGSYWSADLGPEAIFVAKMYGADHTFRTFSPTDSWNGTMYQDDFTTTELLRGSSAGSPGSGLPAGSQSAMFMRWE